MKRSAWLVHRGARDGIKTSRQGLLIFFTWVKYVFVHLEHKWYKMTNGAFV